MKSETDKHGKVAAVLAMALTLSGCTSSPQPNYHLLRAPPHESPADPANSTTILVHSITLPDHLRRQELIFSPSSTALELSSTERWAEPLDQNISDVLVSILGEQFGKANVFDRRAGFTSQPDKIIRIDISDFEMSGNRALIAASWEVSGREDQETARYSEVAQASVSGASSSDRIVAMEKAVANLADKIAASIKVAEPSQRAK